MSSVVSRPHMQELPQSSSLYSTKYCTTYGTVKYNIFEGTVEINQHKAGLDNCTSSTAT